MRLLSVDEVAEIVGFARSTVNNWAYRRKPPPAGFPPPIKIGGKLLWLDKDIDDWLLSLSTLKDAPPPELKIIEEFPPFPPPRPRGRPRKDMKAKAGA